MKPLACMVFLLIGGFNLADAQSRRYANAFLEIPAGARGAGMGGAYSAVANDATAFYWNPAGLALVSRHEATALWSSQFGGLAQYHMLGYNHQLNETYSFAVGWIHYGIANIPENSRLEGDLAEHGIPGFDFGAYQHGHFSYTDNAIFLSFARMNKLKLDLGWLYSEFPIQIPVGINFKIIRGGTSGISGENGVITENVRKSGIGVDIGTMIMFGVSDLFENPSLGDFTMAFNLQDATTTAVQYNELSSDVAARDIVKPNLRFGMSYIHGIDAFKTNVLVTYESNSRYTNDRHYGLELEYLKLVSLRMGLDNGQPTFGAGIFYENAKLDYTLNNHPLGYTHRIGVGYKF